MDRVRQRRGFALREMALVLAILAGMAGVVAQRAVLSRASVGQAACVETAARIDQAIEKWYFDRGRWPAADLRDLFGDSSYFPGGPPRCPVADESYRMDPATQRVIRHRH